MSHSGRDDVEFVSTVSQVYSQKSKTEASKGVAKGGEIKGKSKDMNLSQRMYHGEIQPRFEVQCHVCGKTGHKQTQCWYREGGMTSKGKGGKSKMAAVDLSSSQQPQ